MNAHLGPEPRGHNRNLKRSTILFSSNSHSKICLFYLNAHPGPEPRGHDRNLKRYFPPPPTSSRQSSQLEVNTDLKVYDLIGSGGVEPVDHNQQDPIIKFSNRSPSHSVLNGHLEGGMDLKKFGVGIPRGACRSVGIPRGACRFESIHREARKGPARRTASSSQIRSFNFEFN